MNEIIEYMLNNNYQIKIEGHYAVESCFIYATGETLEEAFKNWQQKYNERINNPEWRAAHNIDRVIKKCTQECLSQF